MVFSERQATVWRAWVHFCAKGVSRQVTSPSPSAIRRRDFRNRLTSEVSLISERNGGTMPRDRSPKFGRAEPCVVCYPTAPVDLEELRRTSERAQRSREARDREAREAQALEDKRKTEEARLQRQREIEALTAEIPEKAKRAAAAGEREVFVAEVYIMWKNSLWGRRDEHMRPGDQEVLDWCRRSGFKTRLVRLDAFNSSTSVGCSGQIWISW